MVFLVSLSIGFHMQIANFMYVVSNVAELQISNPTTFELKRVSWDMIIRG